MTTKTAFQINENEMTSKTTPPLHPVLSFARANLKGSLKNRMMMIVALVTPIMLLLVFWLLTRASSNESFDMMAFIFPGIVALTVIQAGGMHATNVVNWREQGVFRRLACTPVPLWQLVLGRSLSQLVLSLIQAALVVIVGLLLLQLSVSGIGLLFSFVILCLASACFIALGAVIAGLSPNAVVANSVYVFSVLPLLFLGDSMMPAELFPPVLQKIGSFLPTSMVTTLIRPLMNAGALPDNPWFPIVGLTLYTILFVAVSAKLFRWQ